MRILHMLPHAKILNIHIAHMKNSHGQLSKSCVKFVSKIKLSSCTKHSKFTSISTVVIGLGEVILGVVVVALTHGGVDRGRIEGCIEGWIEAV